MTAAAQAGAYGAEYLATLLVTRDTVPAAVGAGLLLPLPGVPAQTEIDRRLSDYEVYVEGGKGESAGEVVG